MIHIISAFFLSLVNSFSLIASEPSIERPLNKDLVESFLSKPFMVEEDLKVILDGSAEASEIQRQSSTSNRMIYIDRDNWRAVRSRPLQKNQKEYVKQGGQLFEVSPGNRRNRPHHKMSDRFWIEVAAAPVHYAKEWSLVDSSSTLEDLIKKLKSSEGNILKNADGDQILGEFKPDGSLRISSKGKILHDGKTRVQLESEWRLMKVGAVSVADLDRSLLRSHDQN